VNDRARNYLIPKRKRNGLHQNTYINFVSNGQVPLFSNQKVSSSSQEVAQSVRTTPIEAEVTSSILPPHSCANMSKKKKKKKVSSIFLN
jgi:hypothetical protein